MFRENELRDILYLIRENLEARSNGQIDENRTRDLENRSGGRIIQSVNLILNTSSSMDFCKVLNMTLYAINSL